MADLQGKYAVDDEVNAGFDLIPVGDYVAIISASEMKETKSGGEMLKLTFQIIDGEYKGRNLWSNLNLINKNPEAVRIAKGDLAAIRKAVNIAEPKDSAELHDIPMVIGVKCVKRTDNGEMSNEIKSYKPESKKSKPVASGNKDAPDWAGK